MKDNEEEPSVTLTAPEGSTTATQLTLTKKEAETSANIEVITGTAAVTAEFSLVDENGEKSHRGSRQILYAYHAVGCKRKRSCVLS